MTTKLKMYIFGTFTKCIVRAVTLFSIVTFSLAESFSFADLADKLFTYGHVANVRYSVLPQNPEDVNVCIDLRSKIWASLHIKNEDSTRALLTVIRLDNILESTESSQTAGSTQNYKCIWKEHKGWPIPIKIIFSEDGNDQVLEHLVPANLDRDTFQVEINNRFDSIAPKEMKIPRIIFQILGNKTDKEPHPLFKKLMNLVKIMNPNYKHFLVKIDKIDQLMAKILFLHAKNDLSVEQLFNDKVTGFTETTRIFNCELTDDMKSHLSDPWIEAFRAVQPFAFKADIYRYFILFYFGGVYMDSKLVSLTPFDIWLPFEESALCKEPSGETGFNNSLMAMTKNSPILKNCLHQISNNIKKKYYGINCLEITGPRLLSQVYFNNSQEHERKNIVLPMFLDGETNLIYEIKNPKNALVAFGNAEYRRAFTFLDKCHYIKHWVYGSVYYEKSCNHKTGLKDALQTRSIFYRVWGFFQFFGNDFPRFDQTTRIIALKIMNIPLKLPWFL